MKWLKSKWAYLVGVLGRCILNISDRINKTGYSLVNYSLNTDPYITDYMNFSKNLSHVVDKHSSQCSDLHDWEMMLKLGIRKGGCEVQTGNFRRVDCSDNLERSKKAFEIRRSKNIEYANERIKEINGRIDKTNELVGVEDKRIDEV